MPPDLVSKATVYLQSRLGDGDTSSQFSWRTRAQMAYLLTRQGMLVPAALANLRQAQQVALQRDKTSPMATDLGAAYLAAALRCTEAGRHRPGPDAAGVERSAAARGPQAKHRPLGLLLDPLVHDSSLILVAARHFPKLLAGLPVDSWSRLAAMIGEGWRTAPSPGHHHPGGGRLRPRRSRVGPGQRQRPGGGQGRREPGPAAGRRAAQPAGRRAQRHRQAQAIQPRQPAALLRLGRTGYERNLPDTAVTHGLEITRPSWTKRATPSAKPASARK